MLLNLVHHTFEDTADLNSAIHAAIRRLNTERMRAHQCDKLNKAA